MLGQVGMGLHYKLCHALGGTFNLPHAETHAVILPHALAYNARAAQGAMRRKATALDAESAATGVLQLARAAGAPSSLRDIVHLSLADGLGAKTGDALTMRFTQRAVCDTKSIVCGVAGAQSGIQ